MSRVILRNCVVNRLDIIAARVDPLCHVSHKFSLFSFFHVDTYAVFMCVVYIYIFLSLPYGE